jgi:hypothetical protein
MCVYVFVVCVLTHVSKLVPQLLIERTPNRKKRQHRKEQRTIYLICRSAFEALETEHADVIARQVEAEGGRLSHFEALTALAFRWVPV